ncbi:MAG: cytochrome P450 [Ilumatobacteraceae bacterium]|jgi:cytochrome P450
MTTTAAVYWDPYDVEIDTNPYETWRRMRDEAPVYYNERFDFYALSRYADVEAAHRDPARLVSSHGIVLEQMSPQRMETGQMIMMDPPDHTRLRSMAARAFTPKRVASMEEDIRAICRELLDRMDPSAADLVQEYGALLPSMVISRLLGVPDEDRAWAKTTIDTIFHIEPDVGMVNDISLTAMIELHTYLTELLAKRREHHAADMLSDLVRQDLTAKECADFAVLLVAAGTETVARLLGWAAVVLDQHADQRAELAAQPGLVPQAIEELLRFEAPSPVQGRVADEAIALHGATIPAGAKVLLLTGSAGRDERKYPDADRFDIHRRFDHHVSFGFGIHFCLGAALARLEGRVAVEELVGRFPNWETDHGRAERLHTSTVRGWSSVPARLA